MFQMGVGCGTSLIERGCKVIDIAGEHCEMSVKMKYVSYYSACCIQIMFVRLVKSILVCHELTLHCMSIRFYCCIVHCNNQFHVDF